MKIKTINNKGDVKKMEHKDIWLVLGLTVVLAVAVSLSTVSLTGDVIWGKSASKTPTTQVTYQGVLDMLKNVKILYLDTTEVGAYKNCYDMCKGYGGGNQCIFALQSPTKTSHVDKSYAELIKCQDTPYYPFVSCFCASVPK